MSPTIPPYPSHQYVTTPNTTPNWSSITNFGSSSTTSIPRIDKAEDDIKSILSAIKAIEKKLFIISEIDKEKISKFEALQQAYDNYMLIFSMCYPDG